MLAAVSPAAADDARPRPAGSIVVGLAIPDELYIRGRDETVPLPAPRLAWQATARLSVELGAVAIPLPYDAHLAIAHLGARWFLGEQRLGPYAVARAGIWDNKPDEGSPKTFPFAVAGAGVEYSHRWGLALWLELALGAVRDDDGAGGHSAALGIYGSAGLGYRFGR